MTNADRRNRAKWTASQQQKARAAMAVQFEQDRADRLAQLRHVVETTEQMPVNMATAAILASARAEIERLT